MLMRRYAEASPFQSLGCNTAALQVAFDRSMFFNKTSSVSKPSDAAERAAFLHSRLKLHLTSHLDTQQLFLQ